MLCVKFDSIIIMVFKVLVSLECEVGKLFFFVCNPWISSEASCNRTIDHNLIAGLLATDDWILLSAEDCLVIRINEFSA